MPQPPNEVSQKPSRGRPARISLDDIADAALHLGLHDLTMTSLGDHLGVRHSALYRHAKDRDAVIRYAVARAIGKLDWQTSQGDWRSEALALGHALWDLFFTTPGLADFAQDPRYQSEAGAASFCEAVEHFMSFGFDEIDAAIFMGSLFDMTADMVATLQRFEEFAKQNDSQFQDLLPDTKATDKLEIMQRDMEVIVTDTKAWWRKKMALLISGAEQMILTTNEHQS